MGPQKWGRHIKEEQLLTDIPEARYSVVQLIAAERSPPSNLKIL